MTDTSDKLAKSPPELDLDRLMERIRAEVAERKRLAEIAAPVSVQATADSDFATRRWTARDLLALPGAEFARCVHIAFFGREPKPHEFTLLRDRVLVAHVGRTRILREFRGSPEARASGRRVEGFWRASAWDRLYWSPPAKCGRSLGRVFWQVYRLPRRIREFVARVEMLEQRATEASGAIRALQSAQFEDRQKSGIQISQVHDRIGTVKGALSEVIARRAGTLEHRLARQQELSAEFQARLKDAQTALIDHWRVIVDQKLCIQGLLAGRFDSAAQNSGSSPIAGPTSEKSDFLDPLYLSFEDRYRGTRDEIKQRQRIYVPRVEACHADMGGGEVIDIGCGRGEWLELLKEAGIAARGYDLNRIAVAECRERGLDAHLGDALDVLAALPEGSCSVVTGFHIIEHVEFQTLVAILDHSLRALKPGGLLVLETPNPANLVVAAERFYFDPTHRSPLPSELTSYLLKVRGFEGVEVIPLHPVQWASRQSYDDPMLAYLQDKLFGPQDYAVIGGKAA